jgi:HlyD family secretion protein
MSSPFDRAPATGASRIPESPVDNGRGTLTADTPPATRVVPGRAVPGGAEMPPRRRPSPLAGLLGRKRVLAAIVALLLLAFVGWRMVRARAAGEVTYRFATVEQGSIQQTVSATGNLSAVKTVQVGTQVSGQVAATFADFNDRVTKGQLLARIDPTLQEQAVRDAEAQLARANAQLNQAQQEYNRNAPLAAQKFISASEFGTVQVNRSVALAGVKSAQVTLDRAKQNLSYTNIYAPINGVVVERNVDVGQTVAASLSAPQLFLIAQDLAQMQILASVDESDISSIKEGQEAQFTVQSYQGRTFKGVVDQVRLQSKTTDNVVSYTAVVKLENADGKLLPGMTATVDFITGAANDVLTVPNSALRYKPSADELAAAGLPAAGTDSARRGARAGATGGTGGATAATGAAGAGNGAAAGAAGAAGARGTQGTGGAGRTRAGARAGGPGTLYALGADGKLKAFRVRIGLSDGQRTQVMGDGVIPGLKVIVGSSGGATASTTTTPAATNPLTPARGGGGPGGGRGF